MKKGVKVTLLIALSCVVLGIGCLAAAFIISGGKLDIISQQKAVFQEKTYECGMEGLTGIEVRADNNDVVLTLSNDEKIHVTYGESEWSTYAIEQRGDTLRISLTDSPIQEVRAGVEILRALRLRRDDIEIVSCPTCGRTRVDLMQAVARVNAALPHECGYLRVAVMGCAVNGPGEATDADIGIAFGDGNGVLFKHGEKFAHGQAEDMIALLVHEATAMLNARRTADRN